jgi:hypothetical protein
LVGAGAECLNVDHPHAELDAYELVVLFNIVESSSCSSLIDTACHFALDKASFLAAATFSLFGFFF